MKVYFKEGQRVFSPTYGAGIVASIDLENSYPVFVRFENGTRDTYTYDGRSLKSYPITLSQKSLPPIVNEPISEEFVVGDWVVITKPEGFSGWVPGMNKYINRVVRVKEVLKCSKRNVYFLHILEEFAFSDEMLRAAEIDEIPV